VKRVRQANEAGDHPDERQRDKCETLRMDREPEVLLEGGNLTNVVRIGDTVRREAGPWTPFVHRLLRHVRENGFTLAPEPLGLDSSGREILTYIPGHTLVGQPWPEWVWSEELLDEAVAALVDYHAKVVDFRPKMVESRLGTQPITANQIVCHNDFAPYNCVFENGHLAGLFDWDVVCAGSPTWDLAFFAWHWVPLYKPSNALAWRSDEVCGRRLRRVVDSYGLEDRTDFLQQIVGRIEASQEGIRSRAANGDPVFERLQQEGHVEEMQQAITYVRENEIFLNEALSA
jgi:hypothetical protein